MHLPGRHRFIICLLLLSITTAGLSRQAAGAAETDRVLMLHSYGLDFRWTVDIDAAVRDVLERDPDGTVIVHSETLDAKYFTSTAYTAEAADFLRRKYEGWSFDAIIVSDNFALEFARRHRDRLWPDTPLVFCGINNYSPALVSGLEDTTGVAEGLSAGRTISAMRRLFPGRRRLHVLSDDSATGDENVRIVRDAVERADSDFELVVHEPLTASSLSALGAGLDGDDIAILVGLVRDASMTPLDFDRSGRVVARSLPVPVFSLWDFYMTTGIAGGYMSSGREQGREAARLTRRVLDGEEADSIPVVTDSPNVPVYDLGVLAAFGIGRRDLPAGSVIYNEPVGLWERYQTEILLLVATFLLLVILTLLAYEAARRRGVREASTAETLREKETLLREIHHRVKNNLQVVSSMLSMQSGVIADEQALSYLRDARTRVQSMALVHEHLYGSRSVARINTREYIDDLVATVVNSMDVSRGRVQVVREVAEIPIDIDRAIPLGLVVNEVLSNALKYAYPEGTAGDVRLSLSRTPEGALLEVADDGVGMPAADSGARQSLGLQLVEALAGQLGGNVRFENTDPGLAVRLTFPLPE